MKVKAARVEALAGLSGPPHAVRHYLRRQGWCDRSIRRMFDEYLSRRLLVSGEPWIDDEVRAGLCAAADQALLGLAAIPAATLAELQTKVGAFQMGEPRNLHREHLETMLEVAILADVARLKPAAIPPWLKRWVTH